MMLFSRKFFALSAFFLGLLVISPHDLLAIGEEYPIIALSNNNIYAVSPLDGEATLLVKRDAGKDVLIDEVYGGSRLELSTMSPDNTKFAFTTPLYEVLERTYKDRRAELANLRPRELFLVDIASGEITAITNYGANFAEAVENERLTNISDLTWSADGTRLYYLTSAFSMRNRLPQRAIEYYDLASGETQVFMRLNTQVEVRGLYTMPDGLMLLASGQNQGNYIFTLYGDNGNVINTSTISLLGTLDCTNGIMFDMNPVFSEGSFYYGYYDFIEATNEMPPMLLDAASGTRLPVNGRVFPSMVSHNNPDTSLRVVYYGACRPDVSVPWALTDSTGEHINGSDLGDIYNPYQITLSPDGQSVAVLNGETIRIIDVNSETTTTETLLMENNTEILIPILEENGTREIPFSAERILWGAFDFTFAPHIARG